jgi:hypothetical protein
MSRQILSGTEYAESAEEGDVIEVAQYEGALRVNHVSDIMLGVEFVNQNKRNSTSKHLMTNKHSGRLYLVAGRTDKGEVKEVEILAA